LDKAFAGGGTLRALTRLIAAAAVILALFQGPHFAQGQQQASWDGTWVGGWDMGEGVQLIFAGDELIGLYWHEDYVGDARSTATPGAAGLTITWPSVEAILLRDGDNAAHIVIRETGHPEVTIPLARDH
jgi:hypothetical protein